MKLQLNRFQLEWNTSTEKTKLSLRINIVDLREFIIREIKITNDGKLNISSAERLEIDIPKHSYEGKQQIIVELIAANSNIIASGDSILKDLLPTANEDYNFEIKLSGQGGGGVLQSSGIIDDVDALKEELRQKRIEVDHLKQAKSHGKASESSGSSTGGDNSELVRQLNDYKSTIPKLQAALEENATTNNEKKISSTAQSMSQSANQVKKADGKPRPSLSPERSREGDKRKIEELERTVRSLQLSNQTMTNEKEQVHKAVSETNSAAADFLYQLELQNLELSNQIDQEVGSKQQMESDLKLCRSNLKRSLEQLKKQVDINERLMLMLKSVQLQTDENSTNQERFNSFSNEVKQQ